MADVHKKVCDTVYRLQKDSMHDPDTSDCIFGFKPWICASCQKETAHQRHNIGRPPLKERYGRAPEAKMEPEESVLMLDWKDRRIPNRHCFCWAETSFAVDVCDVPMILML
jgi:hypothetical protein